MRCERCAGLVVADHFIGGASSIEGWAFGGWRCINCGAIGLSGETGVLSSIRPVAGGGKYDRQSRTSGTKFHRP